MSAYLKKARDPISSYTHFWGAVCSGVGLLLLLLKCLLDGSVTQIFSSVLFGVSLIALYTASAVYHFYGASAKKLLLLRKLDHSMIFVLIAGTYTPVVMSYLPWPRNLSFTAFIWGFAALGIAVKLCWFNAPRALQTLLYLVMGWSILFDVSLFSRMNPGAITLLVLGGAMYTVGGVIYMLKKPNLSKAFGFHELFHVFVLLGSFFHFLLVFFYVA